MKPSAFFSVVKIGSVIFSLSLIYVMIIWCFDHESMRLYLSEMNDRGYKGSLVILAVAGIELLTLCAAVCCRRIIQATIRGVVLIGLLGLHGTTAYTPLHLGLFVGVMALAIGIVVFSYVDFMQGKNRFLGYMVLAIILSSFFLLGFYSPSAQKILLILFVLVEMLNIYFSFPFEVKRRYVNKPDIISIKHQGHLPPAIRRRHFRLMTTSHIPHR